MWRKWLCKYTQVLTSNCIKLCKHTHLLWSIQTSTCLRTLLQHSSNLFWSRFIIQVFRSEPRNNKLKYFTKWTRIRKVWKLQYLFLKSMYFNYTKEKLTCSSHHWSLELIMVNSLALFIFYIPLAVNYSLLLGGELWLNPV